MIFIAALFLIVARFLSVWAGTPFPIDLVTSDSMNPTLMEGDVVAWTPTRIQDIKVGDVIVYKSHVHWPGDKIVVHRVNDILTSSSGKILLETKGDNNEWTDQKGPHQLEDYIEEDHLMGKVISVGNTPLKIPFIGLFGVWINSGLDLISQPTQSKDSISYTGIFAPLTISAVILVVLIFVLPEKARTIKEKLRYFIIGPRPLNLKNTFASFLIAYIVFFMVIHAFAYDSTSASLGIESGCPDSSTEFGRVVQGKSSFNKSVPVINPSAMAVKGIVFTNEDIRDYVTVDTFELKKGQETKVTLRADVPKGSPNGSFTGNIMVYSSPFWLLFPDGLIKDLLAWNPENTIIVLDLFAGLFLTTFTLLLLLSITFIADRLINLSIDNSWARSSRVILKKRSVEELKRVKNTFKNGLKNSFSWLFSIDFMENKLNEKQFNLFGKPIIASLLIIPIIFLFTDQIFAMILSVFLAGVIAYFISCKLRNKIILTAFIVIFIAFVHMIIQSNIIIFEKNLTFLELMSLSMGAIGVYLLVISLLLVPLSVATWLITRYIRNVKEQKDPLLCIEGNCDL